MTPQLLPPPSHGGLVPSILDRPSTRGSPRGVLRGGWGSVLWVREVSGVVSEKKTNIVTVDGLASRAGTGGRQVESVGEWWGTVYSRHVRRLVRVPTPARGGGRKDFKVVVSSAPGTTEVDISYILLQVGRTEGP